MARHKLKKAQVRPARFQWPTELQHLLANTLNLGNLSPDAIHATAQMVKTLSNTFLKGSVSEDGVLEKYGDDPDFHQAYAAYFLQVNVPKMVELFHEADLIAWHPRKILDFGTGPGTAIIAAFLAMTGTPHTIDITAVDHSRTFLATAERLIAAFRKQMNIDGTTKTVRANLVKALALSDPELLWGKGHDLVVMSNALAELPEEGIEKLPEQFNQWFHRGTKVVFMEPAQRVPARRLLRIRDRLCELGWQVRYPCPGNYGCPALARERDWCHHRLTWKAPELVTQIDRLTGMNKNVLNFTPLVMEPPGTCVEEQPRECPDSVLRVISEVRATKGKMELTACGRFEDGSHLKVCMLENKKISACNERFMDVCRYDRIQIEKTEVRKERLMVKQDSGITVF